MAKISSCFYFSLSSSYFTINQTYYDSTGKESACNAGHLGSILGLGRSPGEGKSYPLQNSGLEKSMDCIVHGVSKCHTRLSNFHSLASLVAQVVKNMPAMKEIRPRFDSWVSKIPWRRKWQPTSVFFPGESKGHRSLAGYSPWGHKSWTQISN